MSDTMAGLIRAERILREQEQHLAADSVAEAIRALDHWLEQVEKVEALADDLIEDVESVLMLTPDAHGDRCEYGCGVALIEACARRAAEEIAERVTRRKAETDA